MCKLIIDFETSKIKSYFDDWNKTKKKIGPQLARTTKKRHDQLKAAKTFGIYLSVGLGNPHRLYHDLDGYYGVYVSGNVRLIIKPVAESLELNILKNCDTVIIKGVEDYHGGKHEWRIP